MKYAHSYQQEPASFLHQKNGFTVLCLPSLVAANPRMWAAVTTPWPPNPDSLILVVLLTMLTSLLALHIFGNLSKLSDFAASTSLIEIMASSFPVSVESEMV